MINITIIGFGNVGSALTLLLLNNKQPLRLNVMEPDEQRKGAFLDLAHSMSLYAEKELHVNDKELFLHADFIYFTAGKPNIKGGTRLSMAKQNGLLAKEVFENIKFMKAPYIFVITNPVDIIAHGVYQFSGLPSDRIIGTGTFLDSIRLAYYLSDITNYKVDDFDVFVVGEHGASQVPIYSLSKYKDVPIFDNENFAQKDLKITQNLTVDAAFEIRKTQNATIYGVAKCAEMLLNYFLGEEEHFLTLSLLTNEYYRNLLHLDRDIYISMPVTIKNREIEIYNNIQLSKDELDAYRKSAAILANIRE